MSLVKYYISVGEPWDFNSPDGKNIINGTIYKMISQTCILFKANYVINIDEYKSEFFIVYPRYSADDFYAITDEGFYAPVNVNILIDEYNENIGEKELMQSSKFIIVGSIASHKK